jgi:hypothetical protein
MAAAVGERIRRHVENAHELGRRLQRAQERIAMDGSAKIMQRVGHLVKNSINAEVTMQSF